MRKFRRAPSQWQELPGTEYNGVGEKEITVEHRYYDAYVKLTLHVEMGVYESARMCANVITISAFIGSSYHKKHPIDWVAYIPQKFVLQSS